MLTARKDYEIYKVTGTNSNRKRFARRTSVAIKKHGARAIIITTPTKTPYYHHHHYRRRRHLRPEHQARNTLIIIKTGNGNEIGNGINDGHLLRM